MEIKEFEALKKKQEELQLLKAKEETKLEALEKELESYKTQLNDLGITALSNAESLLKEKEEELQKQYNEVSDLLSQLES